MLRYTLGWAETRVNWDRRGIYISENPQIKLIFFSVDKGEG